MKEAEFKKAIQGLPFVKTQFFPNLGSTNDAIANWINQGIRGPSIACADEQTSGRGRAERRWFTPPGSALAFSLLLDPPVAIRPNQLGLFSGLGALSVCLALEEHYSLSPQIKWPNDVLLDGKKVCGILAEVQWKGMVPQAFILGIGVNIAAESVPPADQLNFPATCIEQVLGLVVDPGEFLGAVLKYLFHWKDQLWKPGFVPAWEQRLAYKGESVRLTEPLGSVDGYLLGLNPDGSLRLDLGVDVVKSFNIGEIQLRRNAK